MGFFGVNNIYWIGQSHWTVLKPLPSVDEHEIHSDDNNHVHNMILCSGDIYVNSYIVLKSDKTLLEALNNNIMNKTLDKV